MKFIELEKEIKQLQAENRLLLNKNKELLVMLKPQKNS